MYRSTNSVNIKNSGKTWRWFSLKMNPKEIGDMIENLKDGKAVICPECKEGKIVPKEKNGTCFWCDKCNFSIHLNRI